MYKPNPKQTLGEPPDTYLTSDGRTMERTYGGVDRCIGPKIGPWSKIVLSKEERAGVLEELLGMGNR